jgi:DNA-directed RNA polymerase subunit M/transcription elongation factor TFIIS
MNVKDVVKMLEEENGSHTFPVNLPSLGREVRFKPMRVVDMKTMSKMLMEDENTHAALTGLILNSACETLDLTKLNEVDRIKILINIKIASGMEQEIYLLKCSKCESNFEFRHDLESMLENFGSVPKEKNVSVEVDDKKYDITVGLPSVALSLLYNEYSEVALKKAREISPSEDVQKLELYLLRYACAALFMRTLAIDGNVIEDFDDTLDVMTRNFLVDSLPAAVAQAVENAVTDTAEYSISKKLSIITQCPSCGEDQIVTMEIEDFFQV